MTNWFLKGKKILPLGDETVFCCLFPASFQVLYNKKIFFIISYKQIAKYKIWKEEKKKIWKRVTEYKN